MKLFITLAVLATATAKCGPKVKFQVCTSSGDPHYSPFAGRAQKFTMMGDGEHMLAQAGNWGVHSCQKDVHSNKKATKKKVTWNKDVVAFEGDDKVEVFADGRVIVNGKVERTNVWRRGTRFTHTVKRAGKTVFSVRRAHRRRARVDIRFLSGKTVQLSYYEKKSGRFGNRKFINVVVRVPRGTKGKGLCYEGKKNRVAHAVTGTAGKFTSGDCQMAPPATTSAPVTAKGKLGTQCTADNQCTSGFCYKTDGGARHVCSARADVGAVCYQRPTGMGGVHTWCKDGLQCKLAVAQPSAVQRQCVGACNGQAMDCALSCRGCGNSKDQDACKKCKTNANCHGKLAACLAACPKTAAVNSHPSLGIEGKCVDPRFDFDDIIAQIRALPCKKLVREAYAKLGKDAHEAVYDASVGCTTDGEPSAQEKAELDGINAEKEEQEEESKEYTCPKNSFVSAKTWPLSGFDDCTCIWGYEKKDTTRCEQDVNGKDCDQECVKTAPNAASNDKSKDHSTKNPTRCFCDPKSAYHCMHDDSHACMRPVQIGDQASVCDDPKTMHDRSKCVCSRGTSDCSSKSYKLKELRAPSLATPKKPFGAQPIFALYDGDKLEEGNSDDDTEIKVSIATVRPKNCGACTGSKPCKHNALGDNNCHAKMELFGEMVCPAGTTECVPEETNTQLYRVDPNDPTVERKDQQCRHDTHVHSKTTFCADETPCKHHTDGTCMPKQTWIPNKLDASKPIPRPVCRGVGDWRLAVPAPVRGWHFTTDESCDLTDSTVGCSVAGDAYAMDKWCDHNCRPKVPGQKPYCPKTHCDCGNHEIKNVAPKEAWRCPLDRYADGSCFCPSGTEQCGGIKAKLHKGVVSFQHLTIGKPGKYKLQVEVVKKDKNTGSSVEISATSSVFEVRYPAQGPAECRAKPQWRHDDLDKSEVQGAGKAWAFSDDTVRCTERFPDGECKSTKKVFAMDKWCKANRCGKHTSEHCTNAPAEGFAQKNGDDCPRGVYDNLGDCCDSGRTDQCGVCDGDGSTCKVSHYLSTFATESETGTPVEELFSSDTNCPRHAPCAHAADKSCVPKTYSSSDLVDENFKYAPYGDDTKAVWRRGSWDGEDGQRSLDLDPVTGNFRTLETGNLDCFCPKGTVDLTARAIVAEKVEADFKADLKKKIADVQNLVVQGVVEASSGAEMNVVKQTVENKVELFDQPCSKASSASKITIEDGKAYPLATKLWTKKNEVTGVVTTAKHEVASKKIKCVKLPGGCNLQAWKSVKVSSTGWGTQGVVVEKKLTTLVNEGTGPKLIDIADGDEHENMQQVEAGGNILKLAVQLIGSTMQCLQTECSGQLAGACGADQQCNGALDAAKTCAQAGGDPIQCMQMNAVQTNAFRDTMQCFSQSKCLSGAQDALTEVLSKPAFLGKKRRLAAGVTVNAHVSHSGNLAFGSTSSSGSSVSAPSATATGKFAPGANSPSTGLVAPHSPVPAQSASTSGMSTSMLALAAVGSVAALVGAAVGIKKFRAARGASSTPSSSDMASAGADKEEFTDVL